MSGTGALIGVDLLVAVVTAAAWLGAGAAAATGRARVAAALLVVAVVATLARVGTVAALAGAGWWFVQEKVTLTVPLLIGAGLAATLLAGPRLVRPAARQRLVRPAAGPRVVVPLLSAGYAAVAGPVVTFLAGYPATWPVALVTVALVGAAALVTWRVVAPARSRARPRAAAVVAAVAVTGAGFGFAPSPAVDTGGGPGGRGAGGVSVSTLRGPTQPAPGGEVRRHTLTARQATVTLPSGRRIDAWTFNGRVPGPPITAELGDLVEVTLRNDDIREGVTLHWHGYDVPSGEDGVPGLTQQAVAPGEEFVYRFLADQAGTYWYHTHSVSDVGVRKGLFGTLVVTEPDGATTGLDLTLPVHTFEGSVEFGEACEPNPKRCGGGPVEHRAAPGTPVRLRLVNTDDTPHRFALAGTPYRLTAVDGRDLHQPGEVRDVTLRLPAGGRYDLAFEMPNAPVVLMVGRTQGLSLLPDGFSSPAPAAQTTGWPELDLLAYGRPAPTLVAGQVFDRDFTLVLDRGLAMVDGIPRFAHTVNGRAFPAIPTQLVAEGDLVRFTVVNRSLETHPWHLHGHAVLVLSRDGREAAGSPLWLDTFDVRPGEVWEVAFRADNPGLWMNHCHNLPHAHQGMMLHLAYQGVTTPHRH